jgi:hypothetical protein
MMTRPQTATTRGKVSQEQADLISMMHGDKAIKN